MTTFVALLFLTGLFEFAMSIVIFRAAPERYDNRVFAAMGVIEGALQFFRGYSMLEGLPLTSYACLHGELIANIAMGYLGMGFAYSFPFSRRPPLAFILPTLLVSGAAMVLAAHPVTHMWFGQRAIWFYFLPVFAVTLFLLWRNSQRLTRRDPFGIPLIMVAFVFRWAFALFTYLVGRTLSEATFHSLVDVHATGAAIAGEILMGYAILKSNLFQLRGLRTTLLVWGGLGAGTIAMLAFAVDFGLRTIGGETPSRAALVLVGLGPVALLGLGVWLRPLIYQKIVCPIDSRFAKRRSVLERSMERLSKEFAPERLMQEIGIAVRDMTGGGKVELLRSPEHPALPGASGTLGPALAQHLTERHETHLHHDGLEILPSDVGKDLASLAAEILVPVRRGTVLFGALALTGGEIDRDAVVTATVLAEELALKLENFALFVSREKLEAELAETRRLASLGSFAAAIAHEIRTPLTSVQMNVQILQSKVDLAPKDMEYFDIALEELRRLNQYIGEILDYAKPMQLHPLPSDLREIAEETARSLEPILREKKVTLARDYASALPAVPVDAQRMRQVLVNLLDNAANASSEGGEVVVRTRTDGDRAVLEIEDKGKGIAAEDLPKIFEPFFTTRPDGTGLGLAIAQKIAKAHGAEILVESAPGKGATFRMAFPFAGRA